MKRKIVSTALLFCMVLSSFSGCGKTEDVQSVSNGAETEQIQSMPNNVAEEVYDAAQEDIENYQKSTAENDTDLGLKNIKIDTAMGELTEEQKMIIHYFSKDYIFVNSIEALQRYNKIFDKANIECYVNVEKVISYVDDSFELLVNMIGNSDEAFYDSYDESTYMIIKGQTDDSRFIQGDNLIIEGKYMGVYTKEVDGKSITVPEINVHSAYLLDENDSYYFYPSRFSMKDVKRIAKCIFGEDITITNPDEMVDPVDSMIPYYVCTLDNQSSGKFSKYYFSEREGAVWDAVHSNYDIEFSADYSHFFLFMYDWELETLTLEYYDNNLNKIWKREFEDTTSASYDFTKNNVYLCANNNLYILNIETGEDTFNSKYIGDKLEVRKFNDGILAISQSKSDAFMFMDLQGNILWTQNAEVDIANIMAVQQVEDHLVIKTGDYYSDASSEYYYVLDISDGTIIYSGKVDLVEFHQYS